MRQYFYIVSHTIEGDNQVIDKVFLQENEATKWGRALATKHSNYSVALYKQPITRTGEVEFVTYLNPFTTKKEMDKRLVILELTKAGVFN